MKSNDLQKQLRRYFHQIDRQLPCPRQERKRFLDSLKADISAYRQECPQSTMEDILEQFGTVADTIDAYASAEHTIRFMRKRKWLQVMVVALVICLTASVLFIFRAIYLERNTTVTKVRITIETTEEYQYEEND